MKIFSKFFIYRIFASVFGWIWLFNIPFIIYLFIISIFFEGKWQNLGFALVGGWMAKGLSKSLYRLSDQEAVWLPTDPFEAEPEGPPEEDDEEEVPQGTTGQMQWMAPLHEALPPPSPPANGSRANPIALHSCSNEIATLTVLKTLRSWEKEHGNSIRFLDWEAADENEPDIHRVRFQRQRFTKTEIQTDRVSFYFDFSAVEGITIPSLSPTIWSYGEAIAFPHDLGWLHFDNQVQNSQDSEPLNVSLFYSCPEGNAAIYIYGSCVPDDMQAIVDEAEKALVAVQAVKQEAETPWPFDHYGSQYGRFLLIGNQISFLGISAKGGKFIKVRLTFNDEDKQHREMLGDCMSAISRAIEGAAHQLESQKTKAARQQKAFKDE